MIVQRNPAVVWYLSKDEYKFDYFGTYCSGISYVTFFITLL